MVLNYREFNEGISSAFKKDKHDFLTKGVGEYGKSCKDYNNIKSFIDEILIPLKDYGIRYDCSVSLGGLNISICKSIIRMDFFNLDDIILEIEHLISYMESIGKKLSDFKCKGTNGRWVEYKNSSKLRVPIFSTYKVIDSSDFMTNDIKIEFKNK